MINTGKTITINLPDKCTKGDLMMAQGAIIQASTNFVAWENLYGVNSGQILLAIAHQLGITE